MPIFLILISAASSPDCAYAREDSWNSVAVVYLGSGGLALAGGSNERSHLSRGAKDLGQSGSYVWILTQDPHQAKLRRDFGMT